MVSLLSDVLKNCYDREFGRTLKLIDNKSRNIINISSIKPEEYYVNEIRRNDLTMELEIYVTKIDKE